MEATMYARYAKGSPQLSETQARNNRVADFHAKKAREYSEAKYRPWAVWSLGD